jgi:hypothetical protein
MALAVFGQGLVGLDSLRHCINVGFVFVGVWLGIMDRSLEEWKMDVKNILSNDECYLD